MALPYTKAEAKEWARKHLRGLEAPIFPSFTPDLQELDEDGIRYDVNHIIANGMTSILAAPEACGLTFAERKRFVEIVCEEARGRVHTSVAVMQDTVEQDIEMLQHIERVGGTFATLGHPIQYHPWSVEDIFQMYKYMCDSTNLGICFYAGRLHVRQYHPSYFPPELLPRIADIPNVVAMKIGGGSSLAITVMSFRLCGERILVNDPMPDRWFVTIPEYGQQWAGAGPFYAMQTPERPRMVDMFNLLVAGDVDKAMDIYWETGTGEGATGLESYFHAGIVMAMSDKYAHWCNGGNGGLVRQPTARLHDFQKERIRAGLRALGFTPREPEEEFYVGRVNYAKGARLRRYELESPARRSV
jgi:4-hydroxy-tetrahydrodipicolinate synthase